MYTFKSLILCFLLLQLAPAWAEDAEQTQTSEAPSAIETKLCEALDCQGEFPLELNFLAYGDFRLSPQGLGPLNQSLENQGYSSFRESTWLAGGAIQLISWNVLTEMETGVGFYSPSQNKDFWTSLNSTHLFVNLGYVLRPIQGLQIYPLIGLGGHFLDLDFRNRSLLPSFNEVLSSPGRQSRLSHMSLAAQVGLGLSWQHDWWPLIGLRGGWVWSPSSNNWLLSHDGVNNTENSRESTPISGGPDVALSGPYLRLMVGF